MRERSSCVRERCLREIEQARFQLAHARVHLKLAFNSMPNKTNVFEIVLLVVGLGAAVLGFQLINQVYKAENSQLSWLMVIAIFSWLTLLVLFILLSLMVDVSKKELNEIKTMIYLISEGRKKK